MAKKAIVYFQSGGPTPVINSSLYGVIREYQQHKDVFSHLYASRYGVEGLLNGDLYDLDEEDDKQIELLKQTPGQIIGSSRKKLPSFGDPLFKNLLKTVKEYNIGYILANGGNDSMDTCNRLNQYFRKEGMDVKVLGIPKTVDNDLMETDHSVGYSSAARHIMDSAMMAKIDLMNYRKGKIVIMEMMGRDTGWLTASVALLPKEVRPDYIYIPEMSWNEENFISQIKEIYEKQHFALIALSEGAPLKTNNLAGSDSFGHKSLEGCSQTLARIINDKLNIPTRVIAESTIQRADSSKITVVDSKEAIESSRFAVKSFLTNETGKMVSIKRVSSSPYQVGYRLIPLENVANMTKKIPDTYIKNNQEMSEGFVNYLAPLVNDVMPIERENGNILYAKFHFVKAKKEIK